MPDKISKLKRITFWGTVILVPGGSLLLTYRLLKDSEFRKKVSTSIKNAVKIKK